MMENVTGTSDIVPSEAAVSSTRENNQPAVSAFVMVYWLACLISKFSVRMGCRKPQRDL